jgi:cytochrome c553
LRYDRALRWQSMLRPAHAADIAAGKEKAELCVGCHGEGGISQTENIPSLAAQPDQFIQWQLVFFRAGARKNEQMQPIVEQLNNDDIRNLGAYFASLTPPKARSPTTIRICRRRARRPPPAGAALMPHRYYAGTKAVARVAGQREEYLVKALHDYKSGVRSGGAMAAMADVAYPLSEEEIDRAGALSGAFVIQVVLHPPLNGGPMPPASSWRRMRGLLQSNSQLWVPTSAIPPPQGYPRCFSYALRCV